MRSHGSSCACFRPSEMRLFSASTFRISTSTSSPFFTTSEGCCTRFVHDMSEMWIRPSIPGSISTNAPNEVRLRTLPLIRVPTGYFCGRAIQGSSSVCFMPSEIFSSASSTLRTTEEDPWMALPQKYPVGTRIRGKVRNLTSFGAFVEIEPGIDGLIHISDMSWTKRVQHPSEVVKKGDEVDVLILNVDAENKRISLGLKQAQEDPWLRIGENYPVGMDIKGKVVRLMDKGVVVDLGSDIEGFVPMSQLGIPDIQNPGDAVKEGQAVELKVLEVDPIHHRIVLAATGWPKEDGAQQAAGQETQTLDA